MTPFIARHRTRRADVLVIDFVGTRNAIVVDDEGWLSTVDVEDLQVVISGRDWPNLTPEGPRFIRPEEAVLA